LCLHWGLLLHVFNISLIHLRRISSFIRLHFRRRDTKIRCFSFSPLLFSPQKISLFNLLFKFIGEVSLLLLFIHHMMPKVIGPCLTCQFLASNDGVLVLVLVKISIVNSQWRVRNRLNPIVLLWWHLSHWSLESLVCWLDGWLFMNLWLLSLESCIRRPLVYMINSFVWLGLWLLEFLLLVVLHLLNLSLNLLSFTSNITVIPIFHFLVHHGIIISKSL
jgi:hypothetical protein